MTAHLCKLCEHARRWNGGPWLCARPTDEEPISLVNGQAIRSDLRSCDIERSRFWLWRWLFDTCGPAARFWQPMKPLGAPPGPRPTR